MTMLSDIKDLLGADTSPARLPPPVEDHTGTTSADRPLVWTGCILASSIRVVF